MPAAEADLKNDRSLPFPPISKSHILNCSFHSWYPRYRTHTPKVRLIPLPPPFVDYLRADGIVLPPETPQNHDNVEMNEDSMFNNDEDGDDDDDDEDEDSDPSASWPDVHAKVSNIIAELGGAVAPKLNWSAPKDATWINATNSMDCRTPNDIYLLLKSSNFITHDLDHAFDGCVAEAAGDPHALSVKDIPFHLVLRKWTQVNPSVEFRCFVRHRKLIGISQRDLNHYDFLEPMLDSLRDVIQEFFDLRLRDTFPDENFAFDVYVPAPHKRVWLMDINPWAPRTDPLLFSWLELLEMDEPPSRRNSETEGTGEEAFVRLSLRPTNGVGSDQDYSSDGITGSSNGAQSNGSHNVNLDDLQQEDGEDIEDEIWQPEFRLIRKNDPEAYNFNTPQYSAHKLPRDVVEASQGGAGPQRELLEQWQEVLARMEKEDAEYESDDEA